MLSERPATRPGPDDVPLHYVIYPGRSRRFRGWILCQRPRQFDCHYIPLLNRTAPCLKVSCWGCKGSQALVNRIYLFLPCLQVRPSRLVVVGIQRQRAVPIWDYQDGSDSWRGLEMDCDRGSGAADELKIEVRGRAPDNQPLPPEWDVCRDLEHVWQEFIPRQWDGRLTPPPPNGEQAHGG